MRIIKLTMYIAFTLILFYGCATSSSSSSSSRGGNSTEVIIDNPELGLDVYIKKLSGVRVSGSGASANISIRGADNSSLRGETRPLFVIDGMQVGRDFGTVYNTVSMHSVHSVKVMHMSRATIRYGHEGSNGVIEITTQ